MGVNVREKTIEGIKEKLLEMNTDLNKLTYLESALRETGFSFEIKRFLFGELALLYAERKMYEKAGKAMANKASMEISAKDKIDSYIMAADYYSKIGKVDICEDMFVRAIRDSTNDQKAKIKLARKNIYSLCVKELESTGKNASAVKFYEKMIKMDLDPFEKTLIKEKLIKTYKALGMFREARLLEGL